MSDQPPEALPTQGWPQPMPTAPPSPLPAEPREYHQMLRGGHYRWWRAMVALPLAVGIEVLCQVLAIGVVGLAGVLAGVDDPGRWLIRELGTLTDGGTIGPAGFLYVNLGLIALIPATTLSIWAVHHIRPRFVSSVQGGLRWRWLLRCVLIVLPVWAAYLLLGTLGQPVTARPAQWLVLLALVLVLTPLQAAGEEYFFRGWVLQNIGSWFRSPVAGLVVAGLVSVGGFSVAHGSLDPWILGSIGLFAVTALVATWRTGGLEAAIVLHATNNVGLFVILLFRGGWEGAFVSADTKGTGLIFAVDLVAHAVVLTAILWQARRAKVQRLYQPAGQV